MAAGDIILFRKIYIDYTEPQFRCIRVKDFGRDKYQYFDGTEWVTTTLTFIAEYFANELHKKYKFMIFEKSDRIAEIDRMYPGMDFAEQNAQEIDDITVNYAKITEHVTKLGVLDSDFINEIKRGIRGVIGKPSVEKKMNSSSTMKLPKKKHLKFRMTIVTAMVQIHLTNLSSFRFLK